MLAAMAGLLVSGGYFCYRFPVMGRKLIAGSALIGLTQIFPIIQIAAGIVGLGIAHKLGLAVEMNDEADDYVAGELGGFVVTFIVGSILILGSAIIGWCAAFLLPVRWFHSAVPPREPS